MLELSEYQEKIREFAVYPSANTGSFPEMNYLVLGLSSEAGEVAGKLKKLIRDNHMDEHSFMLEVGDCLWYIAMICNTMGLTLQELAEANYDKLYERKKSGTLKGSGDVRIITPSNEILVPAGAAT